MKKDLLFEIGLEEVPAKFMPDVLRQMEELTKNALTEAFIPFESIKAYGTPRRLAVLAGGLAEEQPKRTVENKGPSIKIAYEADGNLTKAAAGFARGQGVDPANLVQKDGYVYAVKEEGGQKVSSLLPQLLQGVVNSLNFPKTMRWSDLDFRFVRPIHWLVALFGSEVIPLEVARVTSSNKTRGHRFLSKGEHVVNQPADYLDLLRSLYVLADPDERRAIIKRQVEELAVKEGGQASIDEELLEEVVYLVEYPTALCGRFDEEFLSLPKEAIITPMREHQRYFPVFGKQGELLPMFITVRNGGDFNLPVVAAGNERVLRARLSDAAFFFNEDRKQPLSARLEKLKTVVFQEGLGSIYDKAQRLRKLAAFIAGAAKLEDVDGKELDRAAELAKADLVTGMVCEFTELQGVMGREYAKLDGEAASVSEAIFEHYLPRFAGDILPAGACGRLVGIADKIDNIVATFSRGFIPTGSQDPYALRRQALGVVAILADSGYRLSLPAILAESMYLLSVAPDKREELTGQLIEFFKLRLKNLLTEEGLRYDQVDAVLAAGIDDVAETFKRAQALKTFAASAEKMGLAVQAFTRVSNILKQAKGQHVVKPTLFAEQEEKELYASLSAVQEKSKNLLIQGEYLALLGCVSDLAAPVNGFFDAVMVMAPQEDIKNNRLALLAQVAAFATTVADLSKIVEE